jgi:hypothetical protein
MERKTDRHSTDEIASDEVLKSGSPEWNRDAKLLLAFLKWMGRVHCAKLCSPGYAGEMLDLGPDEDFVMEFLDQCTKIHAVSGVRKV